MKDQLTLIEGNDTCGTHTSKLLTCSGEVWLEVYPPYPIHTVRYNPEVLTIEDLVIVSAGVGAYDRADNLIEFLDIKNRKWLQSNFKLPHPLSLHHMALWGEYIYIHHQANGCLFRMNTKHFMSLFKIKQLLKMEEPASSLSFMGGAWCPMTFLNSKYS